MTFDIEIDFENYTVPEDRAAAIRQEISQIKDKSWIASLSDWIMAEGQIYTPFGEQAELGGNQDLAPPIKRIAWEEGHVLSSLEIIYDSIETEIKIGGKAFFAFQKLPKGDEILVSRYNTDLLNDFNALETELYENLKVFLKVKTDKSKAFQERFKKSAEKTAEKAVESTPESAPENTVLSGETISANEVQPQATAEASTNEESIAPLNEAIPNT